MKRPTLASVVVGLAVIAVLLAGCNGSASGVPDARADSRPHLRWAAPDLAKTPRLLFISDSASGDIEIYSMPDLTLKAQFQIGSDLQGECPDPTTASVYIVNAGSGSIGQLYRTFELHTPEWRFFGTPLSCAVNPMNGDVAVTSNGSSGGSVQLFRPNDIGYGRRLSVPHMYTYFFAGYDRRGNLWVDGYTKNSTTIVASCMSMSCRGVPIRGGKIFQPGFVQYAPGEATWYVADRECGGRKRFCIYPVSGSGMLGKRITLTDAHGAPVCDMFQGAVSTAGSRVFVGAVNNGRQRGCGVNRVARWNFPAGGKSTHGNDDVGASPSGAAISTKIESP